MSGTLPPRRGLGGLHAARLESAYLVGGLLLFMSWLLPWWFQMQYRGFGGDFSTGGVSRADALTTGNPAFQVAAAGIYVISGLVLLRRLDLRRIALAVLVPVGLVAWAWASLVWAEDPDLTLRRCIAFTGSALFAAHLATLPWSRILGLVTVAGAIACGSSLGAAVLIPEAAVHGSGDFEGAVRGLFDQKNMAGHMAELGLMAVLACAIRPPPGWKARTGIAVAGALCVGLVLASTSRTALGLSLVGVMIFLVALPVSLPRLKSFVVLAGIAALVVGLVVLTEFITAQGDPSKVQIAGRDLTATGRTILWQATLPYASEHLGTGWGYRSFWTGAGASGEVWAAVSWDPPNGHSSWIDAVIDLGLPGLAALLFLLGATLWAARPGAGTPLEHRVWAWALVVGAIIQGSLESLLLEANNLAWIMVLATYLALVARLHDAVRAPSRPL